MLSVMLFDKDRNALQSLHGLLASHCSSQVKVLACCGAIGELPSQFVPFNDNGSGFYPSDKRPKGHPDLVFIDTNIIDSDVMNHLHHLTPFYVLTGTQPSEAHKAFKLEALDFLMKPVELKSLLLVLDRCCKKLSNNISHMMNAKLTEKKK